MGGWWWVALHAQLRQEGTQPRRTWLPALDPPSTGAPSHTFFKCCCCELSLSVMLHMMNRCQLAFASWQSMSCVHCHSRSDISLNVALETMKAAAEEGHLHNDIAVGAPCLGLCRRAPATLWLAPALTVLTWPQPLPSFLTPPNFLVNRCGSCPRETSTCAATSTSTCQCRLLATTLLQLGCCTALGCGWHGCAANYIQTHARVAAAWCLSCLLPVLSPAAPLAALTRAALARSKARFCNAGGGMLLCCSLPTAPHAHAPHPLPTVAHHPLHRASSILCSIM